MINTKYITRYDLCIRSTGMLKIGDEDNDVLVDAYSGEPMLPASGVVGAIRACLTKFCAETDSASDDEQEAESNAELRRNMETSKRMLHSLFGDSAGNKSRLFAQDGRFHRSTDTVKHEDVLMEYRERVRIDSRTGTSFDGGKFHVDALASGQEFDLTFVLESRDEEEKQAHCDLLEQAFTAMNQGAVRFGAQKTNGAGTFEILSAFKVEYNLHDESDMEKYLLDAGGVSATSNQQDGSKSSGNTRSTSNDVVAHKRGKNILPQLQAGSVHSHAAIFTAEVRTVTPLMVGGVDVHQSDEADKQSVQNAHKEYIVPASSFKGVLRAQCEKIAEYLNLPAFFTEEIFGREGKGALDGKQNGAAGILFAEDVILYGAKSKVIYNRIALDKFTGGVRLGAKFDMKPVEGKMKIRFSMVDNSDNREAHIGLVLLALKDILEERVSLGGSNNVGYGRVRAREIHLEDEDHEIVVPLNAGRHPKAAGKINRDDKQRTTGETASTAQEVKPVVETADIRRYLDALLRLSRENRGDHNE